MVAAWSDVLEVVTLQKQLEIQTNAARLFQTVCGRTASNIATLPEAQ